MTTSNSSDPLRGTIEYALAGKRIMARVDLESLPTGLSDDASMEIWRAWLSDSPAASVAALQRVLSVVPNHPIAMAGLVWAEHLRDWEFQSDDEGVVSGPSETPIDHVDAMTKAESWDEVFPELFTASDETPEPPAVPEPKSLIDGQTGSSESTQDNHGASNPEDAIPEDSAISEAFASSSTQEQPVRNRPLVLAIDDSPTVRRLVSMTLERVGYEVVTAADGAAAQDLLAERIPSLIIADARIPQTNGYKLCRQLKKQARTREIPIIMLSAKHGVIDKVRRQMAGCADFISKPFETNDLIARVCKHTLDPTSMPSTTELVDD